MELINYRCFINHKIHFRTESIVVGQNNAGKSTLIEALRLTSIVVSRFKLITYKPAPEWVELELLTKGIYPDIEDIEFNFDTVRHRYSGGVPSVTVEFENKIRIKIFIGESEIFAIVIDSTGKTVRSKAEAIRLEIPEVRILPQIGPLLKKEYLRNQRYVLQSMTSHLASLHFRNQIMIFKEHLKDYSEALYRTWSGLELKDVEMSTTYDEDDKPRTQLFLNIRDNDFIAEVSEMGHGLQMWLQILWFLSLSANDSIVVLDEPDVYMHADLQKKLIRFIRNKYKQVIIATHSIEIISEITPKSILVVDKNRTSSRYADSEPAVQNIIEKLGTNHNLQITKLATAKKCLFVEGEDAKYLSAMHSRLFPNDSTPFDSIPHMEVKGRSNWSYSIGSSILNNDNNSVVRIYCIIDRDYHSDKELNNQLARAKEFGVDLYIWNKKEIENYLLVPTAIKRIIDTELQLKDIVVPIEIVESALESAIDKEYEEVFDAVATGYLNANRSEGLKKANQFARRYLKERWGTFDEKLSVVSGKTVLSSMSTWAQEIYGVSFSAERIAWELVYSEIHEEVRYVVSSICSGESLFPRKVAATSVCVNLADTVAMK